ncbi:beta-propeller domain-containing protein [Micromonospora sp. C28SCA-DRY-2]|uniref:beta-propeller domain-containing protein n=1 Tax=Micromonospora sp. C28SCA-DRY-2 TaxID=3059522 RepID=UPI002677586E|nr:beta-propeller domain-containing protein [Micromonospora sp. C28SCA-DRY-2]MDO3705613.1 beta-propeller domain-containing protein [Micromonospora sp. C28SCA-DRY-2]
MKRGVPTAAATTLVALALLAGSTTGSAPMPVPPPAPPQPAALRLVSFDSCAEALAGLRAAASASVGPWGFSGGWRTAVALDAAGAAEKAAPGARAAGAAAPEHTGTNNHEADADEPDLVKTDGRRIVTVTGNVLRVVDPATRRITGRLDLTRTTPVVGWAQNLLLHGDRALVLVAGAQVRPDLAATRPAGQHETDARLLLVDLTGAPRITGTYRIEGDLADARLTGSTARVVIRSAARLTFPYAERATDAQRTATNRAVIAAAGIDAWLPAYEWTDGPLRHTGRVGCERLSRPDRFSGASTLTVLSFDLAADRLGDGDPVSVAADADTVYGTGRSLYLAGQRPPDRPGSPRRGRATPAQATDIHQFDTAAPGRPRYVATGSVPGWLVNQYALSEWQGHLRVATTVDDVRTSRRPSESTVHVLRPDGGTLTPVGSVTGLGRGERIYSVRFLGAVGYVVTFRQTDPLYSLDLTEPTAPRVTGELKITGYSAYLHPLPDGRLLGVGQEADGRGRTQGLQVSLFDVRDPARPTRLDQYHVPDAYSSVEFDPHAFLYHPDSGLVALPVDDHVRLLRVTGDVISEVGPVRHPSTAGMVSRSLLVGGALWTVSEAGLRATDPATTRSLAWLPST